MHWRLSVSDCHYWWMIYSADLDQACRELQATEQNITVEVGSFDFNVTILTFNFLLAELLLDLG